MALKAELEELLAQMKVAGADDKEIEQLRGSLEKHQPLRDGFLRQSDYDRKFNDIKAEREREATVLEAAKKKAEDWQKWADKNKPIHENLLTEYEKSQKAVKELEEKVAAATSGGGGGGAGGGEVDEAKIMERVKAVIEQRGKIPTAEEIQKIAMEEAKKLSTEAQNAFFKDTLPAAMEYSAKMNDFAFDHHEEFKERFDRIAFAKFVTEKRINDLDEGYKQFVGDKRTENKIKVETDKRVKDELSKRNLPGSGAEPAPSELGVLQNRRAGKDVLAADATIAEASAKAAAELRAEGKV